MLADQRRKRQVRRRAGRSTLRVLRREAWREARRVWPHLLGFLLVWLALALALSWLQRTEFMQGLFAGFMIGVLGFFGMVFLVGTGIAQRQMGGAAEQWTAGLFEELDRGRWFVAHDVSFEAMNIDHVLVGPRRIYAVETKWTSWQGNQKFVQGAQACSQRGARKLRALLASQGLDRKVIPLVLIWGPHTRDMQAEPEWVDGVGLVAGVHADSWLSKLRSSAQDVARDLSAERAITEFMADRQAYTDAK